MSAPTGAELNQCLCKNQNNFVYNSAACIGKSSSLGDVEAVYETMASNCAGTGVTLSVPRDSFLAAANAAAAPTATLVNPTTFTTSMISPTSSPTKLAQPTTPSTAEGSNGNSNTGLSTGTKAGIGVGVAFGVVAAALAAWFIWAYQKRHKTSPTATPTVTTTTPFSTAAAYHPYASDNNKDGNYSPEDTSRGPSSYYDPASLEILNKNNNNNANGQRRITSEYAQDNTQQETAELLAAPAPAPAPTPTPLAEWKPPSQSLLLFDPYAAYGARGGEKKEEEKEKEGDGVSASERERPRAGTPQSPAELPGLDTTTMMSNRNNRVSILTTSSPGRDGGGGTGDRGGNVTPERPSPTTTANSPRSHSQQSGRNGTASPSIV